MAESARQKRMRELGVTPPTSSPSTSALPREQSKIDPAASPSTTAVNSLSAREQRKIDLGVVPDNRKEQETKKLADSYAEYSNTHNQFATDKLNIAAPIAPKKPIWNGLKDNPITKGVLKAADYALVKPGETVAAGIADTAGAINNALAPKKTTMDGSRIYPSEKRNLIKDVKDIWTNKEIDHSPLEGAAPNDFIRKLPGTGVTLGDVENFGLQGMVPGKLITAPFSAAKYAGTKLGEALSETVSKAAVIANDAQKLTSGPVKLKVMGQQDQFARTMDKVIPIAKERMVPPLENEKELAKWVHGHLNESGYDVSLNEVKKMGYEDLRQYSEVIKPSAAKTVDKVSNELGYGKIFDETNPTLKQTIAKDATERAYGFPAPKVNVGRELKNIKGAELKAVDTPKVTPETTKPVNQSWFTRLFGEQNVGFTPFSSSKSSRMVSTEQQIVNNHLKNNVQGVVDTGKQAVRAGYQNTVDYLSPLKTINRETYNTAMDASRANNLSNTIIRDKFVDNEGNVIGDSLNDIMKNVRGMGKKFDDYLILRHAETRMSRGEQVYDKSLNMTPEKAAEKIAVMEKRYPGLKEVGQQWNDFHGNLLDSGVKEGLLTPEARNVMRENNPNYASMRRQFTLGEKLAQPKFGTGGSSFSGQSAPIKSVSPTGSTRKIVTPIRSAIEQTYAWKNAELRNRTMQEITKTIQLDPEAMKGIVEIVKKPSTSFKSLDDALRDGGSEEFLQQLDNDFKSLFKAAKPGEENIVRAMVNGKPIYIKVNNPEAVKALLGLGSEQSGIVLAAMQKLSNATKRGATGLLAPMFAVKNLTADTVQAAIQSPAAFKHIAVDMPHALISSIGDIFKIPGLKNLAEDFRRSGGEYSALLRDDRGLNKAVGTLRKEAPFSAKGIAKGTAAVVKAPFKALEKLADTTENVNRMAAFRRSLVGKERTPENVRNAINAARESTTNFSRKGAHAKETEAFIPYSNAAVQGIYRISKAMYKNPVKTLAAVSTLVLVPKLYEYAKFNDDPDYQKLPARERYRNIIISKNKNGTFNKQPMPPEYEAFGAFMTDVLNDVINKDPQAYKGTMESLANAFTPPIVSGALQGLTQGGGVEKSLVGAANATVAAPFVATIANQSFTGAPIVPQRLQDNSAEFQSDERTSKVAQAIGRKLDMAPLKVDYLLRSYGGDPARLILPLTSDAGGGMPKATLLKNFIVDPVFTNTLSNDFYDAKDKYTKANNDYEQFDKPLPKWFDEGTHKLLTSQSKGSVSKMLSAYADDKRTVQGDKTLTATDKAKKIRDIQAEINQIYVDTNSDILKSGYKFPNR